MPCAKGTRYQYVAYLSIEDFFAQATSDYCLAANLEPHLSNADFKSALMRLRAQPGVNRCIIPVIEYEDADQKLGPCSDRIFMTGAVDEAAIAEWARQLNAEYYHEERPGAEIPREHSNGEAGWFLVWD